MTTYFLDLRKHSIPLCTIRFHEIRIYIRSYNVGVSFLAQAQPVIVVCYVQRHISGGCLDRSFHIPYRMITTGPKVHTIMYICM